MQKALACEHLHKRLEEIWHASPPNPEFVVRALGGFRSCAHALGLNNLAGSMKSSANLGVERGAGFWTNARNPKPCEKGASFAVSVSILVLAL